MSVAHGMYVKDKKYIQDLMTNLMVRDLNTQALKGRPYHNRC
jgi:hypothetical protein